MVVSRGVPPFQSIVTRTNVSQESCSRLIFGCYVCRVKRKGEGGISMPPPPVPIETSISPIRREMLALLGSTGILTSFTSGLLKADNSRSSCTHERCSRCWMARRGEGRGGDSKRKARRGGAAKFVIILPDVVAVVREPVRSSNYVTVRYRYYFSI